MATDLTQFDAHGALPEDLAHEIFETIFMTMLDKIDNLSAEEIHKIANATSRKIQTAVADHMIEIQWKMLNRRTLHNDQE